MGTTRTVTVRVVVAALIGALLLAVAPSPAHAAPQASASAHYLYLDNGACPDDISVFHVSGSSLSLIQTLAVGCEDGGYFGGHHLRRTLKTNAGPACLFFASDGDGDVYSLVINGTTGHLTLVSSLGGGDDPTDLLVIGRDLVETDPPSSPGDPEEFNTYAIQNNCSLSLLQSSPMSSEVVSVTELVGPDLIAPFSSGSIGTYALNARTGALTLTRVTTAQMTGLDGADTQIVQTSAGQVVNIFVGQAVDGPPEVEAAQTTATGSTILPFTGSPGHDGDASARDGVGLLVYGSTLLQLNNVSNQLAWYHLTNGAPNRPGSIAYGGDIGVSNSPTDMVKLGTTVFVATAAGIDACEVVTTAVTSCATAAAVGGDIPALAIL